MTLNPKPDPSDDPVRDAAGRRTDGESSLTAIGWREWVSLPGLGLPGIKAKIDTGARTSALHAFHIVEERAADGSTIVAFDVQPLQRKESLVVRCRAPLVDCRMVTDSGGHAAERYVVRTELVIGGCRREVEITLSDRRDMLFRMLVGRTSLKPDLLVDSSRSFTLGRASVRSLYPQDGHAA